MATSLLMSAQPFSFNFCNTATNKPQPPKNNFQQRIFPKDIASVASAQNACIQDITKNLEVMLEKAEDDDSRTTFNAMIMLTRKCESLLTAVQVLASAQIQ